MHPTVPGPLLFGYELKRWPLWVCLVILTCDGDSITFEGAGDEEHDPNYCAMLEEALLNPAAFDPEEPSRIISWARREYYIYCTNGNERKDNILPDTTKVING